MAHARASTRAAPELASHACPHSGECATNGPLLSTARPPATYTSTTVVSASSLSSSVSAGAGSAKL